MNVRHSAASYIIALKFMYYQISGQIIYISSTKFTSEKRTKVAMFIVKFQAKKENLADE